MTPEPYPESVFDPESVFAEVAALATSHGWTETSEFTQAVPEPGDRGVAILATAGTDPDQLIAWITEPVAASSGLEPVAEHPAGALAPNRVLIALRCGHLLTSGTVAAASMVLARPAGTYRIVLTGAEDLESAADLATVERGLWRVLLAPDGAEWRGQDIAAHGCLLWSDADTADSVRDRVATDVTALHAWLTGPVTADPELDRDRAAFAVSLAMDELHRGPDAGGAQQTADRAALALEARRLTDVSAQVHGLHDRLLSRLDSDAETTERQVLASLRVLEQDLAGPASARRDSDPDHARRSVGLWAAETEQVVVQRYLSSAEQARHLLERGDWDLVNRVAPHPRGHRYPAVLTEPIAPSSAAVLPAGAIPADIPAASAATGSGWNLPSGLGSVSPGVLVTAGIGAAALGILGTPLLPLAGAAVLGVVGGSLYEKHRADEQHKRAQRTAGATVSGTFANAESAIKRALHEHASGVRAAVDAEFTTLQKALGKVAEGARQAAATAEADTADGPGDQLRTRLATLREQLARGQETTVRSKSS
jgi:hypothetical protein